MNYKHDDVIRCLVGNDDQKLLGHSCSLAFFCSSFFLTASAILKRSV